ncbi:MAG: aspartyl protease family protein, partial [Pseudomonas sp.]
MPTFDPANPPIPLPPTMTTSALWDTGASKSVISPAVVSALALTPVGSTQINHFGGITTKPTYMVSLWLPNRVGITGILAAEFDQGGATGFEVIIGMDVITLGDFSLTNVGGRTCMSFRTPSIQEVDFVAAHNRQVFA